MILRRARWAAACLLAAALPAGRAAAQELDPVKRAEAELGELTARLDAAERASSQPEEAPRLRAQRFFEVAQQRAAVEDDAGALALLSLALEVPEFRASPALWEATWAYAEILRRLELWSSALGRYRELLAAPGAPRAAQAAVRALECAVQLGRAAEAEELYQTARKLGGREPPPEARYLAAKAVWRRRDQPREQRARRALDLLAQVGRPWHVHAAYFRGALRVALGETGAALLELDGCALAEPGEAARGAGRIRDLCAVGAARVIASQGRHREAADAYAKVPVWSALFPEATYEAAYAWLRAGRPDLALRHVAILADLMADSPLGPRASLLRGNLLAQAGRWTEAVESYNRVINQYAPVRDEVEAILALAGDPARMFDELVGRPDADAPGGGLPQAGSRWAARREEMAPAMSLVATLEAARRELAEARLVGDRLEALLTRNYGLAASPVLEQAYQRADEVHTEAVGLEGLLAAEELRRLPQSPARLALEAARKESQALEDAARRLPTAPREMEGRRRDALVRLQTLQRRLAEISRLAEGVEVASAGLRAYLDQHRAEIRGGAERPLIAEELRRHREMAAGYRAEVAEMAQAVNRELDVAGRGLRPEEERVRHEYRLEIARQVEAMAPTRRALSPAERGSLARLDAVRSRLADLVGRADRLKRAALARARADVEKIRGRLGAERKQLEEAARELDRAQASAKQVVGRVATRAFREVQKSFYDLVLQADVGIIDVAWTRKRERLDTIQALSSKKADDLKVVEAAGAGPGEER